MIVFINLFLYLFFAKEINAIYKGNDVAKLKAFRFVASLRLMGRHICGGSILNEHWILTAAHCVAKNFKNEWDVMARLRIRVGTHLRRSQLNLYNINMVQVHPEFKDHENHDIALLRVRYAIPFNCFTRKIELPIADDVQSEDIVRLAGWGMISKYGDFPRILKEVKASVYDRTWCKKKFNVHGSQICTRNIQYKGPCRGDSGGPVLDYTGKYLLGIISYAMSHQCGANTHSFHTKVYDYLDWINSFLND